MIFKEIGQIGDIFKEGRFHEGFLIFKTWHLGDLIDKVQNWLRNSDHFIIHNFKKFSEEKSGFLNKVNGVSLGIVILVSLNQEEFFHVYIVVLAEQLQEPKHSAKSLLVINFCH
jgi:hypothetical protein